MRDHLLGYPPAAATAALDQRFDDFYGTTYPLGEPTRVADERRDKYVKLTAMSTPAYEAAVFEKREHSNPDGSYTTRGMKDMKRVMVRGVSFIPKPGEVITAKGIFSFIQDSIDKGLKDVAAPPRETMTYGPRIAKVAYDAAMKRADEAEAREQHIRAAAQCLAAYGVALPETMNEAPEHFGRYQVMDINRDGPVLDRSEWTYREAPVVFYAQGKQPLGG